MEKINISNIRELFKSIENASAPKLVVYKGKTYKTGSQALLKELKKDGFMPRVLVK